MNEPAEQVIYTPEMRERDAVKFVMSSRAGRHFIFMRLRDSGFLQNPFHEIPHIHAFNTGQMNVAISLFTLIDAHCPEQFVTMMKESKEDEAYDRHHSTKPGSDSGTEFEQPYTEPGTGT